MVKLACGREDDRTALGRRAEADQPAEEETGGGDLATEGRRPRPGWDWGWDWDWWLRDGGDAGLVLPLPGLPEGRMPLMLEEVAVPPKLMRRAKGVLGAVLALPGINSSSSTADSSIESELELVETLSRRIKVAGLVGELPERPMVLTERRRPRGSVMLGAPGRGGTLPLEGALWKRLERAAWVMELRRWAMPELGALSVMACSWCAVFGVWRRGARVTRWIEGRE